MRKVFSIMPLLLSWFIFPAFTWPESFGERLSASAISVVNPAIHYDPSYKKIGYPLGDVPAGTGVCTDVVIRAYRKLGIDLQELVHEDMKTNFRCYPPIFGLKKPDPNIDHRRVPNLMVFFKRYGESLPVLNRADLYKPGDIVCWNLYGGVQHIGIVVSKKSADGERFMVVHNIGAGQVAEDILFRYRIIGHFTYSGSRI